MITTFSSAYLRETTEVISALSAEAIERVAEGLATLHHSRGRLFILGVGGSAAHASHAVNDFRKICQIEAYCPTDNVSELTARTNDEGWPTVFVEWLKVSRLGADDAVMVLSVGGGDRVRNVSANLVNAIEWAKATGAKVYGIVGRDGGFTASVADASVIIPPLFAEHVTPHTEGIAAVVWHLLVSHPLLKRTATKWESQR